MFANILSRYWWLTLLRGLLWIAFGVIVFLQPLISLLTLALLFGAFALVDGVVATVNAVRGRREHENWWLLLLAGLTGIGIGIITYANPGITALALLFYIAIWAIGTGLLEIAAAIRLRKEIHGEFWMILAGILSVAFGAILIARPGPGAVAVAWLIAGYAIAFGVVHVVLAFRARGFVKEIDHQPAYGGRRRESADATRLRPSVR